jgi:hypothetical protein
MKYDRGVSVLGFQAELVLQSLDGNTHSLMCDCPEDLNHIMDIIARDASEKIAAYMEHLREGHGRATFATVATCNHYNSELGYHCTRKPGHSDQHKFGRTTWT